MFGESFKFFSLFFLKRESSTDILFSIDPRLKLQFITLQMLFPEPGGDSKNKAEKLKIFPNTLVLLNITF